MLRRSRRCRMAACWSTTWHARERFIDSIVARRESVVWRLVDALVAQPVIDNGFVQRTFDVSDMSAQRAIDRLDDQVSICALCDRTVALCDRTFVGAKRNGYLPLRCAKTISVRAGRPVHCGMVLESAHGSISVVRGRGKALEHGRGRGEIVGRTSADR